MTIIEQAIFPQVTLNLIRNKSKQKTITQKQKAIKWKKTVSGYVATFKAEGIKNLKNAIIAALLTIFLKIENTSNSLPGGSFATFFAKISFAFQLIFVWFSAYFQ